MGNTKTVIMNEVSAYRITAHESDFRASEDMSDFARHQAWERGFFNLCAKNTDWEYAYSIRLLHNSRFEGFAVEMYIVLDDLSIILGLMEDFGYENIEVDDARIGIIEEETDGQNLNVEMSVQTFNGHVIY